MSIMTSSHFPPTQEQLLVSGMEHLFANFGDRSYPIFLGKNIIVQAGELIRGFTGIQKKILIISQSNIWKYYGEELTCSLLEAGYSVNHFLLSITENSKNQKTVEQIYNACVEYKIDKSSGMIALGGGVLQDICNYAAATYLRGIPFVQIPTTLLAQADIGIGGCAIDHPAGKSLIGQFYQPCLAMIDVKTLESLPESEIRNGIAEIINKHICLGGNDIQAFQNELAGIFSGDPELRVQYILSSIAVKLNIIQKDETGIKEHRFLLDWGHTITMALERVMNYNISHGQALGVGMHGAAILSAQTGYLETHKVESLRQLIIATGLPSKLPEDITNESLLRFMAMDQKLKAGCKRFVLLKDFGNAFISDVITDQQIISCLDALR
ncbi:MAG: 3-dehydroquinate synthase family protein [Thiothrix sp.]